MKHIYRSFLDHVGTRGVHFYDSRSCNFLTWKEVFDFIKTFPNNGENDAFSERLTETLANYDPDHEFLAVQQRGSSISVELYKDASHSIVEG